MTENEVYHGKPPIGARIGAYFKAIPERVGGSFKRLGSKLAKEIGRASCRDRVWTWV